MKLKDLYEHTPEQIKYAKSAVFLNKIKTNKIKMPRWMGFNWTTSSPDGPLVLDLTNNKKILLDENFIKTTVSLYTRLVSEWLFTPVEITMLMTDEKGIVITTICDDILQQIFNYSPYEHNNPFRIKRDNEQQPYKKITANVDLTDNILNTELANAVFHDQLNIMDPNIFKIMQENARKNYPDLNQ
jgi:hypothetical protein